MLSLLLQLVFLGGPVTSGYAAQVKKDVVVSITFADVRPTRVCTYVYAVDDEDMLHTTDRPHCWTPANDIGSLDVWPNMRLDEGNFKVVVTYPGGRPDTTIYLVMRINT